LWKRVVHPEIGLEVWTQTPVGLTERDFLNFCYISIPSLVQNSVTNWPLCKKCDGLSSALCLSSIMLEYLMVIWSQQTQWWTKVDFYTQHEESKMYCNYFDVLVSRLPNAMIDVLLVLYSLWWLSQRELWVDEHRVYLFIVSNIDCWHTHSQHDDLLDHLTHSHWTLPASWCFPHTDGARQLAILNQ